MFLKQSVWLYWKTSSLWLELTCDWLLYHQVRGACERSEMWASCQSPGQRLKIRKVACECRWFAVDGTGSFYSSSASSGAGKLRQGSVCPRMVLIFIEFKVTYEKVNPFISLWFWASKLNVYPYSVFLKMPVRRRAFKSEWTKSLSTYFAFSDAQGKDLGFSTVAVVSGSALNLISPSD